MPSSGGPLDYTRTPQRFFYRGVSLQPQDALSEGKLAFGSNIRSHQEGTIEVRYGQTLITEDALGAGEAIHSIFRLNDTSAFASGGSDEVRFLGSGVNLYAGDAAGGSYALVDTGYSGVPLTAVSAAPFASARPYLYVADASRMRKFDAALDVFSIGIPQPLIPPTAILEIPGVTYLNPITLNHWIGYVDATYAGSPSGPVPTVPRVTTTINTVVYDNPLTMPPGMASVNPASMDNIVAGTIVGVAASGGTDTVIVQETLPPVAPTTIAAILYDVGSSGACSIQPAGSFSAGQIELPLPSQIAHRYRDLHIEAPPPVTVTRTVDFPINALIVLGGIETARIESIAIGPDGVMSFRCTTVNSFVPTDTITGLPTFRAYSTNLWASGDVVDAFALEVTITPDADDETAIGGIQAQSDGGSVNFATIQFDSGFRATQPEDIIRFGFKASLLGWIQSVRLTLDVCPSGVVFEQDYYFYEWRPSDLVTAVQATSEAVTGYVHVAQQDGVSQGQFDVMYRDQYGAAPQPGVAIPGPNPKLGITRAPGAVPGALQADNSLSSDAPIVVGSSISRQLALGNDAWMTLECRVGDLTRIGTDTSLNLTSIGTAAIWVQILGTADPIVVSFSDCYITGGYGPDVSLTLPPYVYRYSYRSTVTGERTNLSPSMRAGMSPHRTRVTLSAPQSSAPQCDIVDFWKFGGALARWTYIGSAPNANPVVYNDDRADRLIDGGERPRMDLFQPWPTSDLPRAGICDVAGTTIELVSGDNFNPLWAPDTLIVVNGIATQLYTSPSSPERLQVIDNVGGASGVQFSIPAPTLLATALPSIWGTSIGGAWFNFSVGDPNDPGALHWTNSGDPDSSSDANYLVVSSASEPLQNGYVEVTGQPYVASTERIYEIVPTPGSASNFVCRPTACDRGFWTRWCYALSPNGGVFFLAKDGIYYSVGGSAPKPIHLPDLQPLFPQEGTDGEAIRNLAPVKMAQTSALKLTLVGQYLYFDYMDVNDELHTLVYEPLYERWTPDTYAVGTTARLGEPGPLVLDHMMGGDDGRLRQYDVTKITDDEADIPWAIWTPWANGQDARSLKQFGDAILDFNPGGSLSGIVVTPVVDNGLVALDPRILGIEGTVRDTYLVEVGTDDASGYGVISRNFGLQIQGAVQLCDTQRPIFYLWEPAFLPKGTAVARRATDWEDLAYKGAKFVQGVIIRANTFGNPKFVEVQYDGPNGAPQVALTLELVHEGEQTKAYPLDAVGWEPFIAELVRLQGADDEEWTLLDWRFIWEPAPELATQWETQFTTFDYPGFLAVYDGVIAYSATADVTWQIDYQDGATESHVLTSSAGAYRRIRQICAANKGKAVKFTWTSDEPFRLYKRDTSVRVQAWGVPSGYQIQQPFGGPSRVDGAEI